MRPRRPDHRVALLLAQPPALPKADLLKKRETHSFRVGFFISSRTEKDKTQSRICVQGLAVSYMMIPSSVRLRVSTELSQKVTRMGFTPGSGCGALRFSRL